MLDQRGAPGFAAVAIAERVEVQRDALDPQFLQKLVGHRQQFDICLWFPRADDLGVDLVELAIAALLRTLVAEQRPMRRDLERRMLLPAVRQKSARDPGSEFGPQRQAFPAAIVEGVHFLADDIGRLADRTAEHFGFLEHGHFDAAKAIELAHAFEGFDDEGEGFRIGAENVLGSANGLGCLGHGARD